MIGFQFGIALISASALLAPHVNAGQTFAYKSNIRTTGAFNHTMHVSTNIRILQAQSNPVKWSSASIMRGVKDDAPEIYTYDGANILNVSGKPNPDAGFFFFNAQLYGDPPADLAVGSEWRFTISSFTDLGPPGSGTLKVVAVSSGQVDLALQFRGLGTRVLPALSHMPAGQLQESSTVSGTLTFADGILRQEHLRSRSEQKFGAQPTETFFTDTTTQLDTTH